MPDDFSIVRSSEDSIQIQFTQTICPETNARIQAVCAVLEKEELSSRLFITETVPSYCAVTVYFDEEKTPFEELMNAAQKTTRNSAYPAVSKNTYTVHEIPICAGYEKCMRKRRSFKKRSHHPSFCTGLPDLYAGIYAGLSVSWRNGQPA